MLRVTAETSRPTLLRQCKNAVPCNIGSKKNASCKEKGRVSINNLNILINRLDHTLPNCYQIASSIGANVEAYPAIHKQQKQLLRASAGGFESYQKRNFNVSSKRKILRKEYSFWKRFKGKDQKFAKIDELIKNYDIDRSHAVAMNLSYQSGYWGQMSKIVKYTIAICGVVIIAIFYIMAEVTTLDLKKGEEKTLSSYLVEVPNVTFNDVRGIDEVKEELEQVVDFLKEPNKYMFLGGKLPKGILLVGGPGTGKTLLAKAIAGEAGVPFYYASGAEFDEKYVGVGSMRIRNLFKAARENAPCIIFIDEIDACGNKRTNTDSSPYARQTINQLLQEMDGFNDSDGVIVLGATNTVDILDKALRRPGRFDTEIHVLKPDFKGRKEILQLYIGNTVHERDIDLDNLSSLTAGMTGAELANLVNQAAIHAAQQYKLQLGLSDLEYALDKLRMGVETKGRIRSKEEIKSIAFHEAGHALAAYYDKNANPIFKATIRQRRGALGHVSYVPKNENSLTKDQIMAQINIAMAGRVAEELIFGEGNITTGASSDFQSATIAAEQMVLSLGMGKMGHKVHSNNNMSEETKREMELEVIALLDESYKKMKNLLKTKKKEHYLLAESLIRYETLTLKEIELILSSKDINSVGTQRADIIIQQWS